MMGAVIATVPERACDHHDQYRDAPKTEQRAVCMRNRFLRHHRRKMRGDRDRLKSSRPDWPVAIALDGQHRQRNQTSQIDHENAVRRAAPSWIGLKRYDGQNGGSDEDNCSGATGFATEYCCISST